MNVLKESLIRACSELGIGIDTTFTWIGNDGRILRPLVRIPGLGAPNGMLIFEDYDAICERVDALTQAGYGFSVLSQPQSVEDFELSSYRDMFEDWGLDLSGREELGPP